MNNKIENILLSLRYMLDHNNSVLKAAEFTRDPELIARVDSFTISRTKRLINKYLKEVERERIKYESIKELNE